jgi:hypothetical protein
MLSIPTTPRLRRTLDQLSAASLNQLLELFGDIIPLEPFAKKRHGSNSRKRTYTSWITFWGFLFQVIKPSTSCREVVQKLQTFLVFNGQLLISSSTSAYCQARKRISLRSLNKVHRNIVGRLESQNTSKNLWMNRFVKVIDSTSVTLPDTLSLQARWPQPGGQAKGCGFPVMKVTAIFSLGTGALISYAKSSLHIYDGRLLPRLLKWFKSGEVLLADRAFCSYVNIHSLLSRQVDCVFRLHQRRPMDFRQGKRLGNNDRLVLWKKPLQRTPTMSVQCFRSLPKTMLLRQIKFTISCRGFRTQTIFLITTLLNPRDYPPETLAALFKKRWNAELYFRDIKTTMGIEQLRCSSPQMAQKELAMYFIAYNLIRTLIFETAVRYSISIETISFKASQTLLDHWANFLLITQSETPNPCLRSSFIFILSTYSIHQRPNRSEPRVIKRRPKPFQLLSKPRHLMKELIHRGKYRKPTLS